MTDSQPRPDVRTDEDGWPSLAAASAELCSRRDGQRGAPGPAAVSGLASRDGPSSAVADSPHGWEDIALARRPPA